MANTFGTPDLECLLCHLFLHPTMSWKMDISAHVSVLQPHSEPGESRDSLLSKFAFPQLQPQWLMYGHAYHMFVSILLLPFCLGSLKQITCQSCGAKETLAMTFRSSTRCQVSGEQGMVKIRPGPLRVQILWSKQRNKAKLTSQICKYPLARLAVCLRGFRIILIVLFSLVL